MLKKCRIFLEHTLNVQNAYSTNDKSILKSELWVNKKRWNVFLSQSVIDSFPRLEK